MNKVKMGIFLKKLRTERKLSHNKLANLFDEDISINAIKNWEKGIAIPSIDNLKTLSKIYNVSIDEILDGERMENIDFKEKYPLYSLDSFDATGDELFEHFQTNIIAIKDSLKKLLIKAVNGKIGNSERKELDFLIKNFYYLNDGKNIFDLYKQIKVVSNKSWTTEKKYWEVKKLLTPIDDIEFEPVNIIRGDKSLDQLVKDTFLILDDWEKDMFLASMQFDNAISFDLSRYGSETLEEYEKAYNKKYDKDEEDKDAIRFMIKNGACLCDPFLTHQRFKEREIKTIDTIEYIYDEFYKPIDISIQKDGKTVFYKAENNIKNRVLIKHGDAVRFLISLGYSFDESIYLLTSNSTIPDEVYLRFAKKEGLDTNRDIDYIKSDVSFDVFIYENSFREAFEEESIKSVDNEYFMANSIRDIDKNQSILELSPYYVGGNNLCEKKKYVRFLITTMEYEEYLESRDIFKTNKMFNEMDKLDLSVLRNKFYR